MKYMFFGCTNLKEINLLSFKINHSALTTNMFDNTPKFCNLKCQDKKRS